MITQEYLRLRVRYEPETGLFYWLPKPEATKADAYWNREHAGEVAGSKTHSGYLRIKIDGVEYRAHLLAWLYTHGIFPENEIDHRDRVRSNNRLLNLRPATRQQNARNKRIPPNNTSGVIGVTWNRRVGKWQAQIEIGGRSMHLGVHTTLESAAAARLTAQQAMFGEWAGETP